MKFSHLLPLSAFGAVLATDAFVSHTQAFTITMPHQTTTISVVLPGPFVIPTTRVVVAPTESVTDSQPDCPELFERSFPEKSMPTGRPRDNHHDDALALPSTRPRDPHTAAPNYSTRPRDPHTLAPSVTTRPRDHHYDDAQPMPTTRPRDNHTAAPDYSTRPRDNHYDDAVPMPTTRPRDHHTTVPTVTIRSRDPHTSSPFVTPRPRDPHATKTPSKAHGNRSVVRPAGVVGTDHTLLERAFWGPSETAAATITLG